MIYSIEYFSASHIVKYTIPFQLFQMLFNTFLLFYIFYFQKLSFLPQTSTQSENNVILEGTTQQQNMEFTEKGPFLIVSNV